MTGTPETTPPIAIVTGGARRIGRSVSLALAAAGYGVCIHYQRSQTDARELAERIGAMGLPVATAQAELSEPGAADHIVSVARGLGRLDLLVNNASSFDYDSAEDWTRDGFETQMATNLLAPLDLARHFHAGLRDQGTTGSIVNLLDQKLFNINPDFFSYTISKFALSDSTALLAMQLAPICRVNAVAPGLTLVSGDQSPEQFNAVHPQTPLRRGTTPDDVAQAILFLARAPAITGAVLPVDCGQRFAPSQRDVMFQDIQIRGPEDK